MDTDRYARQLALDAFTPLTQQQLADAHVTIVGAGALGSACALYLAGAGIGNITIIDGDNVATSNLHRQTIYTTHMVGLPKCRQLAGHLAALNPDIHIRCIDTYITPQQFDTLLLPADVIVEASDNQTLKYAITDYAAQHARPYVLGGVHGYVGQVASYTPGAHTYRHLFPQPPTDVKTIRPVFGPVPGIIGSVMSAETIKIITHIGTPLINSLLTLDTRTMRQHILRLPSQ